jgi:hypothetical protein
MSCRISAYVKEVSAWTSLELPPRNSSLGGREMKYNITGRLAAAAKSTHIEARTDIGGGLSPFGCRPATDMNCESEAADVVQSFTRDAAVVSSEIGPQMFD